MEPFYFGRPGERLFGIHYPPACLPAQDCAILLCYPAGHEYLLSHRAFRQLSLRLSSAGFHVMRFDFFGCGDSEGDCAQGEPSRWLRDITTAIGELRLRSGCSKVHLAGCRLGAALCCQAGAARGDVARMVLWDPVPNGERYFEQESLRHELMKQQSHVRPTRRAPDAGEREFLGLVFSETAIREIRAIDLLALQQRPAQEILLIESEETARTQPLSQHLASIGSQVEQQHVPVPGAWQWIENISTVTVPHSILSAIVSWFTPTHP